MYGIYNYIKENYFPLPKNVIFSCIRGSISHGTCLNYEEADIDLSNIHLGSKQFYFGFDKIDSFNQKIGRIDIASHELRKALSLLYKCNPDIINLLWTDEKYWVFQEDGYEELFEKRDMFLSKLAYNSFSNYALSQFKKMQSLPKDVLEELENLEEALLNHEVPIPNTAVTQKIRDRHLNFLLNNGDVLITVDAGIKHYIYLMKKYFNGGGRLGKKRRDSIKEIGYNAKNSSQLIRILKQGIEILRDGKVNVDRTNIDATLLIDIKLGKYTLPQIKEMAKDLEEELNQAYEKSILPETSDINQIEQLGIDLIYANL